MSEQYDLIIKNTQIVDGTGRPAFTGNIGIIGKNIAAVGDFQGAAKREIDGSALITCPGFIDIHSHADLNILQHPLAESLVMQGITTFVGGNCGLSPAPMADFIPWGIFTPLFVGSWWHEVDPYTYGPPLLIDANRHADILERKLGFRMDYRTFGEFLSQVDQAGISANYVPIVGHNAIRLAAMGGCFQRSATSTELAAMVNHVAEAMESGAFGFSTGFDGGPGDFASTSEVIELARVVQKQGGIYTTHFRNFDNNYPSGNPEEWGYGICHNIRAEDMPFAKYWGLLEAIKVAETAGIRTQISHLAPVYTIYQNYTEELQEAAAHATLEIIDDANGRGCDVAFDMLPELDSHALTAVGTQLVEVFSAWLAKLGSRELLVSNMRIPAFREQLKEEVYGGKFKFVMCHPMTDRFWAHRITIQECSRASFVGMTVESIAAQKGVADIDALFDIIVEDPATVFNNEDPRWSLTIGRAFAQHPAALMGADQLVQDVGGTRGDGAREFLTMQPGIGAYASYPRYLRSFVKQNGILSLEEAVRKATSAPAARLGLSDRGVIKPGMFADVVTFDMEVMGETVATGSSYRPLGVDHVVVNGEVVYEGMAHTGVKSGMVLKKM